MSQGCPSVSHQLVAASIAFRRARKKFPKDYGVRSKEDNTKTEVESSRRKNNNDLPASSSSSAKCMSNNNDKSQCFCSPSVYSDDGPRYLSAKQSLSIKQSKCTCFRRNKKSSEEESTRWANDQSAVGDVLDKVSTREPFVEEIQLGKSLNRYNHDVDVNTKNNNSTHLNRKKCTCCLISNKKSVDISDPSKLDSLDLLYVASDEKHCHVNCMNNHERLVEDETFDHFSRSNQDDQEIRRSCSKLDRSSTRKEEKEEGEEGEEEEEDISPLLHTCDPRSPRGINLDLLRSSEDHRPRLCHRYPTCPSRHSCRQRRCHSCQQKSERISNCLPVGCTCPSILGNRRVCSWKDHHERIRTCKKKDRDLEEEDDNVRIIDHKDSISILMEKYKSRETLDLNEERKIRKNRAMIKEKKIGNRNNENLQISRIVKIRENRRKDCNDTNVLENSKSCDRCRCQENRLRWKKDTTTTTTTTRKDEEEDEEEEEKLLLLKEEKDQEKKILLFDDDGRNRIRGEGDFYRRKKNPTRSKFGEPWRHTF